MCACVYVCMCVRECVCVCACACMCMYVCVFCTLIEYTFTGYILCNLPQRVLKQIVQNTGDKEESRYKNKVCVLLTCNNNTYVCIYANMCTVESL